MPGKGSAAAVKYFSLDFHTYRGDYHAVIIFGIYNVIVETDIIKSTDIHTSL